MSDADHEPLLPVCATGICSQVPLSTTAPVMVKPANVAGVPYFSNMAEAFVVDVDDPHVATKSEISGLPARLDIADTAIAVTDAIVP